MNLRTQRSFLLLLTAGAMLLLSGCQEDVQLREELTRQQRVTAALQNERDRLVDDLQEAQAITRDTRAYNAEMEEELAAAWRERNQLVEKQASLQDRIEDLSAHIATLNAKIEYFGLIDRREFAELIELAQIGSLEEAEAGLRDFLRRHPESKYASDARTLWEDTRVQIERIAAEEAAAARQAEEEARQAEFERRLKHGNLQIAEMQRLLIGRNREEVTDLLGEPEDSVRSRRWRYPSKVLTATGQRTGLNLEFNGDVVRVVEVWER